MNAYLIFQLNQQVNAWWLTDGCSAVLHLQNLQLVSCLEPDLKLGSVASCWGQTSGTWSDFFPIAARPKMVELANFHFSQKRHAHLLFAPRKKLPINSRRPA